MEWRGEPLWVPVKMIKRGAKGIQTSRHLTKCEQTGVAGIEPCQSQPLVDFVPELLGLLVLCGGVWLSIVPSGGGGTTHKLR